MRENSLIAWIQRLPQPTTSLAAIRQGIGDDAAVLKFPDEVVVTTDLIAEGSHFRLEECSPWEVGRKAIAVNLSDMAAMAARPVAAFVSLLLPSSFSEAMTQELMLGISELASAFDCSIVGGDTNVWEGKLAVNITVLGQPSPRGVLRRDGARPGDILLVTGALGGSRQGHHFRFLPRVQEALILHEAYELHAGMDLSDGLATDLRRMCQASHCGAEVDAERLPISASAANMSSTRWEAQQRALGDGEDFELLIAAPPETASRIVGQQPLDVPVTAIGSMVPGSALWLVVDGRRRNMPETGYEHRTASA